MTKTPGPRSARRIASAMLFAAAASSGSAGDAADVAGPYFTTRIGAVDVRVRRVACAADGTVYAAGASRYADLPGTVEDPSPDRKGVDPYFLVAFTPGGEVKWTRYLPVLQGSYWYEQIQVVDVAVAADGGIWLAGSGAVPPVGVPAETFRTNRTDADAWVAKFAADGTPLFASDIGGTNADRAAGLVLTSDGDAIVFGTTTSPDFPVVGATQPVFGGGASDGFAARVRGDGSGLVWSTYLGSAGDDEVTAGASEHAGTLLLATRVVTWDGAGSGLGKYVREDIGAMDLTRITESGSVVASVPLPRGDRGGVFALAVAGDGGIFAGGAAGYWGGKTDEGFVMRLSHDSFSVDALWRRDVEFVSRLRAGPSGELLATTEDWRGNGRVLRISPDLRSATETVGNAQAGDVKDIAFASDGALCIVGDGMGSPSGMAAPAQVLAGAYAARLPAQANGPPRRVRIARVRARSVDFAWSSAGADVVAYEIERETWAVSLYDTTYAPVRRVPGGARRARIDGLVSGDDATFRVVAVHASGVRAPSGPFGVLTLPDPVEHLVVSPLGDGRVRIDWGGGTNDELDVRYVIQRSDAIDPFGFRTGPFRTVDYYLSTTDGRGSITDDPGAAFATYRIRANVSYPRMVRSAWTYALPVAVGR